ncbi:MAG: phage tail tip lysozyme [Candidatus Nanopelagicales bacterium]
MRRTGFVRVLITATAAFAVTVSMAAGVPAGAGKKPKTPSVCAATTTTPGAKSRALYVWKRLRNAGFSPAASAGVLGYLDHVSGVSPIAFATSGQRIGLAQWPRDRWKSYTAALEAKGNNRWSMKHQVTHLMDEMTATWRESRAKKFKALTAADKAARVFARQFDPASEDAATAKVNAPIKAGQWLERFSARELPSSDDRPTYGHRIKCTPPDVTMTRCPVVPQSFKSYFRRATGFNWDDMSDNAKRMSRCAYINFPHIITHGTYNGHMPDWQHAIDFMMPAGCENSDSGSRTTSEEDLRVGTRLTRYLIDNARRFNLDYLIWQDHVRSPGYRDEEVSWTPIANWRQDGYNNGDCTNTHFDHVHVSVDQELLAAGVDPDYLAAITGEEVPPVKGLTAE